MRRRSIVTVAPIFLMITLMGVSYGETQFESDLSSSVSGPAGVPLGEVATIMIGYENHGPSTAGSAFVNAYIPSGVPAPIDEVTPAQLDALVASIVPDGLGNTGFLFEETNYCEHILIQVQEDSGAAIPIVGLDNGVSAAVSFDLEIPMGAPKIGAVIIDEPAGLAIEFKAAMAGAQFLEASDWDRYSRGSCGEIAPADCSDLSVCFGPRVSLVDPIVADFELVDDGSADPTWGCEPLVGFTPGNIAVIERAVCEFGTKALNAQNAGATAVFLVNDGRCGDFPDSPMCILGMLAGDDGAGVDIPVVQVSVTDGQPILDALVSATPVRGRFGAVSSTLTLDANIFLSNIADLDPDDTNNTSSFDLEVAGLFIDGFETGDTTRWSGETP